MPLFIKNSGSSIIIIINPYFSIAHLLTGEAGLRLKEGF